jgi:hypothetical protein
MTLSKITSFNPVRNILPSFLCPVVGCWSKVQESNDLWPCILLLKKKPTLHESVEPWIIRKWDPLVYLQYLSAYTRFFLRDWHTLTGCVWTQGRNSMSGR